MADQHMTQIIARALETAVNELLDEEMERAVEALRQRLRKARSTIVMNVLTHFDVSMMRDHIVITVKEEMESKNG